MPKITVNYFWLFSLLAPICFAVSNVVDNHVLHVRLGDPVSYDIITTWPTLLVATAIFLTWKVSFAFDAWFVGTAVGFSFAFLVILYNFAMMKEQGTNVVSVIYTSPLFVAVLAFVFLGESLSVTNYEGILLLVVSAFLVLYRRIDAKNVTLGIVLVYAFASAVARVAAKSALEGVDVWSYFFWFLIGGLVGTIILAGLRPGNLAAALKKLDAKLLTLIAATTGFSTLGLVLLYTAFSLGPVALASGLTAIQPTLVFFCSSVLLRFRPGAIPSERVVGRWADARKVGAVLLIVVGVFALMGK
jgi:drug/metabolite transporter (DMT)-like permease